MTWTRDTRPENVRSIGDFRIYSERQDRETAHVVVFGDGREVRVLPSDRNGRTRAHLVRQALGVIDGASVPLGADLAYLVLIGQLAEVGLEWEDAREVTIEEWLEHWLSLYGVEGAAGSMGEQLVADLAADGWEIRRHDDG